MKASSLIPTRSPALDLFMVVSCVHSQIVFLWQVGILTLVDLETTKTSGVDPGFFLGGGALVSCSTSTPINHIVFFAWYQFSIRKLQVISEGRAHPLHPPPRSAPEHNWLIIIVHFWGHHFCPFLLFETVSWIELNCVELSWIVSRCFYLNQ